MPFITAGHASAGAAELHYQDQGAGQPVVLIHGYPLDSRLWDERFRALLADGHRVITYDRRGFGRSSAFDGAADFDTFAADLAELLSGLDLTDVVLVGHAMGSGEVVRYLRVHGSARVAKAVLLAPLPPFLLRTEQTPHGVDLYRFDQQIAAAREDPAAYLAKFVDAMFNVGADLGPEVDAAALAQARRLAAELSPHTCTAMIPTWITDFREDVSAVDVPVLVVHGTRDRILPIEATSHELRELLPRATYLDLEGAPHGLVWTHGDEVGRAILEFLGR